MNLPISVKQYTTLATHINKKRSNYFSHYVWIYHHHHQYEVFVLSNVNDNNVKLGYCIKIILNEKIKVQWEVDLVLT